MWLILIYIAINVAILYIYYKKENGIWQPPFYMAYACIMILLPQLFSIKDIPFYVASINVLMYMAITCNIAFVLGFEKGKKIITRSLRRDFIMPNIYIIVIPCLIIGLYSIFTWNEVYQGSDNVIQSNLRNFGKFAACFLMPIIFKCKEKERKYKLQFILFILSIVPIVYFAFFVKGSRGATFSLILLISILFAFLFPEKIKTIKKVTIALMLMGGVASASIILIRAILVGDISDRDENIDRLDLTSTFYESFSIADVNHGIDLGNAAVGIHFLQTKDAMGFGTGLWDGIVQDFVPRRVVGSKAKETLKMQLVDDEKFIEKTTFGITTMTAYYYAFREFKYAGFILLYFFGWLFGILYNASFVQNTQIGWFVYLMVIHSSLSIFTHGPSYLISSIVMTFILYCVSFVFLRKHKCIR